MAVKATWQTSLKVGQPAPDFEAIIEDESTIKLSDYQGKKLLLFFYNSDGTPTCTTENCNIRDNYDMLLNQGFAVLGVSKDSPRKHQNFIKKFELPFSLISDKDNVLAKRYDIFGEKKFMGRISDAVHRTSFVIDEKGKIERIIHPVISKDHARQVLEG